MYKIEYSNKIVAFIDVLGFSDLVDSDTTELINRYFDFVLSDFEKAASKNKFNFLLISDSLVIYCNYSVTELNLLIKVLCKLQQKLMEDAGILARGAISFGELFIDKSKNVIVGKGLINAFKLEALANFPRIILDRSLITLFWKDTDGALKENEVLNFTPPQPYRQDFLYLNYTKYFAISNQTKKYSKVLKLFQDNYYKNQHIDKYEWLRSHIIQAVETSLKNFASKTIKDKADKSRERLLVKFMREFSKF